MEKDEVFMRRAIELGMMAFALGEVPVGAVVVKKSTGEIVGEGFNKRETDKSPLAHAEIIAIEQASKTLGGWRLIDCEIYVTLEPCPMCSGAIINSRIERVIFGALDKKSGACQSVMQMFDFPFNHKPLLLSGVLEEDCSKMLSDFFKQLRQKKKNK